MRMKVFSVWRIVIMAFLCLLCSLALLSCATTNSKIADLSFKAVSYELEGEQQTLSGHYEEAVQSYTEALRLLWDVWRLCIDSGCALDSYPSIDLALSQFYTERARAYILMGKLDAARKDLEEALKSNNKNEDARRFLEMIDSGKVAGFKAKNSAADYVNRGIEYHNNKQYDSAIAEYTKAIKADINYAIAYYNRGLAYYSKDLYKNCIPDFSKYLELTHGEAIITVYVYRGWAYDKSVMIKEAINDYTVFVQKARGESYKHDVEFAKGRIAELSKGSGPVTKQPKRLRDQ